MTDATTTLPPPQPGTGTTDLASAVPARRGLLRRMFGPAVQGRTWARTAHLLLNLPFGIAWFVMVVVGLSLGAGLLITLIGIPVLLLTLLSGRLISVVDRSRAKALLGESVASPFRKLGVEHGIWSRFKAVIGDAASWKALAYGVIMLPFGIITFAFTVAVWTLAFRGLTWAVWGWAEAIPDDTYVLWERTPLSPWEYVYLAVVQFAAGLVALAIAPRLVRLLARVHLALIRGLIGRGHTSELEERVTRLSESREASVDAAEAERRRIERDLHDGAQQRLVAVAMDLGLARERLVASGDERTAELVGNAHDEAKRAITELRELVRGIHPAVLTDRGLDAAISALAARCPVPVDVHVDPGVDEPRRPPAPVETAAYFVVAEALTNVAKHARASSARVRVLRRDDAIVVEVNDDGVGGAVAGEIGGLAGLRDRVLAVQGTLRIASPPGGPTTLLAELPCGS
jgi:signal transduction histidine kinase